MRLPCSHRSAYRFAGAALVLLPALLLLPAALSPALNAAEPAPADAATPRRVKVLFLGDNGHHKPLDRAREIFPVLARRGIDLTYTDNLSDLNPQTLGLYDALLVYANITSVAPEQEKAILDYVASGKGFVPVHCASACFGDSKELVALMGGRFKSHGTGVFKEQIVDPEHPVMKGLKPIENWDETYVHSDHNEQGRRVLSVRVEGDKTEPYTWVRDHGKGRVFYTAWGHDERTWENPDFENLIERGIRWSAGDWALQPPPAPPEFAYTEANLPNYVGSHKLGEPIRTMQQPVSPADSMRHLIVPPGFAAKLYAAEPQVKKPVTLAWDERGRLWIAETVDYPNELQREGEGNDRLTVVDDTNRDGTADSFTVFADKLSIPTSILPVNGGAIVAQAPHMLYLADTDGDGRADRRDVLFTGWGTDDTHAGPSNLRWGFDNWVYGCVGYSGFRGSVGGKDLRFSSGAFRFKPDGSALEFLGSTNNNTWGLAFSEDNHLFLSTANNNPSDHLPIPNRFYEQVPGMRPRGASLIFDTQRFYSLTENVRQVDFHGSYTAAAGHAIYTARAFPRGYWNSVAFVTEPTGHLVGQFRLIPSGASFKARNDFNLLASSDEWTSPIAAEVGPDGAVWVIDWYNFVVQHNPIPTGFEKGKGNAYVTPRRDKTHGRVYRSRVGRGQGVRADRPVQGRRRGARRGALRNDNMFWRTTAQRKLVQGKHADAVPALLGAGGRRVGRRGDGPERRRGPRALWTLHGLGAFGGDDAAGARGVPRPTRRRRRRR